MALNKFMAIGTLGKDAEVRTIGSGDKVASFSIAVNEKYKDRDGNPQEKTEWINVVAWRGLAQVAESYFKKGTKLYIEGKLTSRSWDKDDGSKGYATEIVLNTFEFCGAPPAGGGNNNAGQNQRPERNNAGQQTQAPAGMMAIPDDDLPF